MFNWELVTVSLTGGRQTVEEWSSSTVDSGYLKSVSNRHAVDGKVAVVYVSFKKYRDQVFMVTGRRSALAALGYPKGNWELI